MNIKAEILLDLLQDIDVRTTMLSDARNHLADAYNIAYKCGLKYNVIESILAKCASGDMSLWYTDAEKIKLEYNKIAGEL